MKRTNLVLNEEALEQAKLILGSKTYSEAVNTALQEVIRFRTFQQIDRFASTGIWDGDLAEIRDDHVSD
ncbi:MAG: type II toxin-antitoxin system VapB family antitoxin [Spirochaetaceae bacterium]